MGVLSKTILWFLKKKNVVSNDNIGFNNFLEVIVSLGGTGVCGNVINGPLHNYVNVCPEISNIMYGEGKMFQLKKLYDAYVKDKKKKISRNGTQLIGSL